MSETFYFISYGSNLNVRHMSHRCPNAKKIGKTLLKGYSLECRAGLTIVPDQTSEIPVGIWEISKDDLRSLDVYEGYPDFYDRIQVDVDIGFKYVSAYVYILHNGNKERLNQSYLEVIKEGYKDFDLSMQKLEEAIFDANGSMLKYNKEK